MITRGETFTTSFTITDEQLAQIVGGSPNLRLSLSDLSFFDRSKGGFDLNSLTDQLRYEFDVYIGDVRYPARVFLSQITSRAFTDDPNIQIPPDAGVTVWEVVAPSNYASDLSVYPELVITPEYITKDVELGGIFSSTSGASDPTNLIITFEVRAIPSQELDLSISPVVDPRALEAQLDRSTIANKGVHSTLGRIRRNGFPLQRFDRDLREDELSAGRIWYDISDHTVKVAVVGTNGLVIQQLVHRVDVPDTATFEGLIDEDNIIDGAVTTPKLKDEAVTRDKVGVDAIGPDQIEDEAVTESKLSTAVQGKLNAGGTPTVSTRAPVSGDGSSGSPVTVADGAIATAKLANGAVTTAKMADASVVNAKIGLNAVGTSEIGNAQVTEPKLSSEVQRKLNASGGGGLSTVSTQTPVSGDGSSGSPVTIADGAIVESKLSAGVQAKLDEAGAGGDPAYVKFVVPQQVNSVDQVVASAGGPTEFHNIQVTRTGIIEHANGGDASKVILPPEVFPGIDITLKSGVYTFNLAIPVSGLSGTNDRKNVTFRLINRVTRAVIAGDYSATYLRGDTFGGQSIIGGSGSIYIPADDTVINIQTGVHVVGGRQTDVNLTASGAGTFEILRNVQSVVETVRETVTTANPVSGTGSNSDPVTIDDDAIAEAKLDAATRTKLNAGGGVADLSGVVGGSGITVTHSNSNQRASVAVSESLQGELVPSGGATNQALLKQSDADHDLKYANTTNIYEYKAAIDSTSSSGGPLGMVTTLMGLDRNIDPTETPAYTGKKITIPQIIGSHFNVPAGQWSVYVTMTLGNTNITGVTMQVILENTIHPSSTVEGIIDVENNTASFVTSFVNPSLNTFEFNIISSAGPTVNVELNEPKGLICIREGLGTHITAGEGIATDGNEVSVADEGITVGKIEAGNIVPDHLNRGSAGAPALKQVPSLGPNGRFNWIDLPSGGGSGADADLAIVQYSIQEWDEGNDRFLFVTTPTAEVNNDGKITISSSGAVFTTTEFFKRVYMEFPNTNTNLSKLFVDIQIRTILEDGSDGPTIQLQSEGSLTSGNWVFIFEDISIGRIVNITYSSFTLTNPSGDDSLPDGDGGHIEFTQNLDLLIPDLSITSRKLARDSVIGEKVRDLAIHSAKLGDRAVTPPKLAPVQDWTINNDNDPVQNFTREENFMYVYKRDQNLDSDVPLLDRPPQWVPAFIGSNNDDGVFELVEQIEAGKTPPVEHGRTNYGLRLAPSVVRQNNVRSPLDLENFIGMTFLNPATTKSRGTVYGTNLNEQWVIYNNGASHVGISPFLNNAVSLLVDRQRNNNTRFITHFLMRTGIKSGIPTDTNLTADQVNELLVLATKDGVTGNTGVLTDGEIYSEILIPSILPYTPPITNETAAAVTRGPGGEFNFYNMATGGGGTIGIKFSQFPNGNVSLHAVVNDVGSYTVPGTQWISFHVVRGIGG